MTPTYKLKASAGDTHRHQVFVGRWLLGDLMIRPGRVSFHPAATPTLVTHFPDREAFEAALDEETPQ